MRLQTSGSGAYSPTNDPFLFQGGYHTGRQRGSRQCTQRPLPLRRTLLRHHDRTLDTGPYGENANASSQGSHGVEYRHQRPIPIPRRLPHRRRQHRIGPQRPLPFRRVADGPSRIRSQPIATRSSNDDPVNTTDATGLAGAAGLGYWYGQREWAWGTAYPWRYYHIQSVYAGCQAAYELGHPGGSGISVAAVGRFVARFFSVKGDLVCQSGLSECIDPIFAPVFVVDDAKECILAGSCEHLGQDISEAQI